MEERVFTEKRTIIKKKTWLVTYFVVFFPLLIGPKAIRLYKETYQSGVFEGSAFMQTLGYPFLIGVVLTLIMEVLLRVKSNPSTVRVSHDSLMIIEGDQETFIAFSDIHKLQYRRNPDGDLVTLILRRNRERFVLEDYDEMDDLYDRLKLNRDVEIQEAKTWDLRKIGILGICIALVFWMNW